MDTKIPLLTDIPNSNSVTAADDDAADEEIDQMWELEQVLLKDNRLRIYQAPMPDALNNYMNFKRFAKVIDDRDHLFYKHQETYTKRWEECIREEWRILEENLPDTIYVRVYESRMDLLRAVIIGPKGTPYHDGLFFFDVHFPRLYPYEVPIIRYHSFGFAINPIMFKCGEVRFKAINTVHELLLTIQNQVLNADPLFLLPGLLYSGSSVARQCFSLLYNEDILIKSLKTMVHIIDNPPKHFEDFVVGHFNARANQIHDACVAYLRDEGSVGGLDKSDSCNRDSFFSTEFKEKVKSCMVDLKKCFSRIGAKFKTPEKTSGSKRNFSEIEQTQLGSFTIAKNVKILPTNSTK